MINTARTVKKQVIIRLNVDLYRSHLTMFNDETIRQIVKIMVYSYPEGQYMDGIYHYLENVIDMSLASIIYLENLDISLEGLCMELDKDIRAQLYPYEDRYRFLNWIEPWSVLLELNRG